MNIKEGPGYQECSCAVLERDVFKGEIFIKEDAVLEIIDEVTPKELKGL